MRKIPKTFEKLHQKSKNIKNASPQEIFSRPIQISFSLPKNILTVTQKELVVTLGGFTDLSFLKYIYLIFKVQNIYSNISDLNFY